MEVYVRPFSGSGEKTQVSTDGGMYPSWSRNGTEVRQNHVVLIPHFIDELRRIAR